MPLGAWPVIRAQNFRFAPNNGLYFLAVGVAALAIGVHFSSWLLVGWLDAGCYVDSPQASVAELARFHEPDYVAAVQRVSRSGRAAPEDRERHGLGTRENPVFAGMFERADRKAVDFNRQSSAALIVPGHDFDALF